METHPKPSQTENTGPYRSVGESTVVGDFRLLTFLLSTFGAVFGVLGALLLAMPAFPGWGFGAFIVSNVAWLVCSRLQRLWPLHVQQWVFLCCSLIGLWNWWLGPLVLG